RAKNALKIMDSGEVTLDQAAELAVMLGLTAEEVIQIDRRVRHRDVSLNAPLAEADTATNFEDMLFDPGPNPEEIVSNQEERDYRRGLLHRALSGLQPRERYIVEQRHLAEQAPSFDVIGTKLGVSRERVRQIEARAITHLQITMAATV